MNDKYCKDCRHFQKDRDDDYGMCASPQIANDLVTGEPRILNARDMRYDGGGCGSNANWFEPKDDTHAVSAEYFRKRMIEGGGSGII